MSSTPTKAFADRPNLIFIITDQQRFDATGCYGNPIIQTPHMDRIAREGVRFTRAYCAHPFCIPTRATLMTGYCGYNQEQIAPGYRILHPDQTVPARLGQQGYRTQGVGKFHFTPAYQRMLNGFDDAMFSEEMRWIRQAPTANDVQLDDYDRYLAQRGLWGWEKPPEIGYNEIKPLINHLPKAHHVTQWCGDQSVQWLEREAPRDQPFLLWSSFVKPHVPYDCPQHLRGLYDPNQMPPPWRRAGELDGWPFYRDYVRSKEWDLYSEHARNLGLAAYYANITFIDEQVGRIIAALERSGQLDNSVIIFSSDHGDMMGDHGLWYKSLGFEGSIHVPLMLWAPGRVPAGQTCDLPVSHYDIARTLLTLGGADFADDQLPGASLLEIAAGRVPRDHVVTIEAGGYVIGQRYKYHYYPLAGYEELFDLQTDPHELHNRAGEAALASEQRQMRQTLKQWLKQYSGGRWLDAQSELIVRPYVAEDGWDTPRPHSRMPWDSRVPPATRSEGKPLSWWWAEHGPDFTSLLPPQARVPHAPGAAGPRP